MWRSSRKAVSAVLGTAIALAIFFTVIIPALLYMQSLQSLFMQEASRRLQYELERIHEKLDAHISLAQRPGKGYVIFLIIENIGTLSSNVPTVYLESSERGLMTFSSEEILGKSFFAPGERFEKNTEQYFRSNDEVIRVKVVTLRGNGFVSKSIGPKQLPYLLLVSLENMSSGVLYTVKVIRSGTEYGCVSAGITSNYPCGDTAEYDLIAHFPGESGAATFMVAPGKYRVEVFADNKPINIPPEEVYVFQDTVIRITLPEPSIPEKVPLRVNSPSLDNTMIILQQQTGDIYVPYTVFLGNNSEPLRNVKIRVTIPTGGCSGLASCNVLSSEKTISRLLPGESYSSYFTIRVTDNTQNDQRKFGGLLRYRINIIEAWGEFTQKKYSGDSSIEIVEIEKQVVICRLDNNNYAICSLT